MSWLGIALVVVIVLLVVWAVRRRGQQKKKRRWGILAIVNPEGYAPSPVHASRGEGTAASRFVAAARSLHGRLPRAEQLRGLIATFGSRLPPGDRDDTKAALKRHADEIGLYREDLEALLGRVETAASGEKVEGHGAGYWWRRAYHPDVKDLLESSGAMQRAAATAEARVVASLRTQVGAALDKLGRAETEDDPAGVFWEALRKAGHEYEQAREELEILAAVLDYAAAIGSVRYAMVSLNRISAAYGLEAGFVPDNLVDTYKIFLRKDTPDTLRDKAEAERRSAIASGARKALDRPLPEAGTAEELEQAASVLYRKSRELYAGIPSAERLKSLLDGVWATQRAGELAAFTEGKRLQPAKAAADALAAAASKVEELLGALVGRSGALVELTGAARAQVQADWAKYEAAVDDLVAKAKDLASVVSDLKNVLADDGADIARSIDAALSSPSDPGALAVRFEKIASNGHHKDLRRSQLRLYEASYYFAAEAQESLERALRLRAQSYDFASDFLGQIEETPRVDANIKNANLARGTKERYQLVADSARDALSGA